MASSNFRTTQIEPSGQQAICLRNSVCVYCSKVFNDELVKTREHVIGKKFVPKNSMNAAYNVILNACESCNNKKSDLENDISVISMHPTIDGKFAADAALLAQEIERRSSKTYSRNTGKSVAEGEKPQLIQGTLGGISLSFNMVGPPQISQTRLFELARLQLMGFFFHLTYNKSQERGFYWNGEFRPVIAVRKPDWGHPYLRWFTAVTAGTPANYQVCTARGFYKMWIKETDQCGTYSWAIEWNKNIRLVGFFGENNSIEKLAETMPEDPMLDVYRDNSRHLRIRLEVASEENDALFAMFEE